MSHNYLFELLDHLNINSFLTNSIKRIYNQSYASLVVDSYISQLQIFIESGIKQGCSVSMFLYSLGIEELAVRIHNNRYIKGYEIPRMIINEQNTIPQGIVTEQKEIKATLYADDTGGICRELESIGHLFGEFKRWGKISGASMNDDKTKILAINSKTIILEGFNLIRS
jgi:hypothetical protein